MSESRTDRKEPDAANALALLEEALSILDRLDMPAEIGGHIDLARCRLRDHLGLPSADLEGPVQL